MRFISRRLSVVCLCCIALPSGNAIAHGGEDHGEQSARPAIVLAPGYEKLEFDAPEPGTYRLPDYGEAGDGEVLSSDGRQHRLHDLLDGRITVLSFIYRACDDVNGCPLATYVLHQVRQQVESAAARLIPRVQLVSMSFDPAHDTPASMAEYAASFGSSPVDWHFLTSASEAAIAPILDAYGQSLSRSGDNESINHVLRVYVIDGNRNIRNIYNSSLLHADTLISDLQTLAMEADATDPGAPGHAASALTQARLQPASAVVLDGRSPDGRAGYDSGEYVSSSVSLMQQGREADLLAHARQRHLGLPPRAWQQALDGEQVALGRQLFYDRRLSLNDTFSCAMCHVPNQGFTVNELATAVGVEGRTVKRNAPTLLNIAWLDRLFHDAREYSLEQQIWAPLLAENEMANPSVGYVLDKIAGIETYRQAFTRLYGTPVPTMQSLGEVLAAYQRTLVAANSPFDRWYYGGEEDAIPASAKAGFDLFTGRAGCVACHRVEEDGALFTDQQLHNTGIGYRQSQPADTAPVRITLAPGVVVDVDPAVYADAAEKKPIDLGRYAVTQHPSDRWKFRTPSLRNIALTAPYMHDGSLRDLDAVIEFYVQGGIDNPLRSPLLQPVALSDSERRALRDFLDSLTSPDATLLALDGLSVEIGERQQSESGVQAANGITSRTLPPVHRRPGSPAVQEPPLR